MKQQEGMAEMAHEETRRRTKPHEETGKSAECWVLGDECCVAIMSLSVFPGALRAWCSGRATARSAKVGLALDRCAEIFLRFFRARNTRAQHLAG